MSTLRRSSGQAPQLQLRQTLILGLGNPGEEYEKTRHNAGRRIAAYWSAHAGLQEPKTDAKLQALVTGGSIWQQRVVVALPETFMNKSGRSVEALVRKYKVKPDRVLVVHDDADLPLGTMKIVKNRGSGGHRGVESVMRALKTRDFVRFRIGTGRSKKWHDRDLNQQVVGRFTPKELEVFKKIRKRAADALTLALHDGVEQAMNEYNRRL